MVFTEVSGVRFFSLFNLFWVKDVWLSFYSLRVFLMLCEYVSNIFATSWWNTYSFLCYWTFLAFESCVKKKSHSPL